MLVRVSVDVVDFFYRALTEYIQLFLTFFMCTMLLCTHGICLTVTDIGYLI